MDSEEIRRLLLGEFQEQPERDRTALLFSQHYADTRGKPDRAAWNRMYETYGKDASLAMLGAIRGIMMGNAMGIPAGSLLSRLRVKLFRADGRSSLLFEIAMLLSAAVFLPLAALHAAAAWALCLPAEP